MKKPARANGSASLRNATGNAVAAPTRSRTAPARPNKRWGDRRWRSTRIHGSKSSAIPGAHEQGAKWEGPSRKARLNIVNDDGHFRGCGVSCPRSTYFDLVRMGTSRNNQLTIERL